MSGFETWFGRGLDQDWVDTANGFWSVLLLAILSTGTFLARYVTETISCFTPPQFEDFHTAYTNQACFMAENYYVPLEVLPRGVRPRYVHSYHLWIPLILLFQTLCFKIPNVIWNTGKHYLTLNLDETVETLKQVQINNPETRIPVFQDAARLLTSLLGRSRFFLAILYLFVKLLLCVNLLGQLVFLSIYFSNSLVVKTGNYLGLNITGGAEQIFRKSILCEFEIRQMQNVHHYTVQCELSISEIYEKVFVFLWYWVFLLAVVTFFNLLLWAGFLFLPFLRDGRISAYIKASHGSSQDSSTITRFISGCLGIDGVLVLSMISRNSSEMVAATLSQQLYQVFLEKGSGNQTDPATPKEETTSPSAQPSTDVHMTNINCGDD